MSDLEEDTPEEGAPPLGGDKEDDLMVQIGQDLETSGVPSEKGSNNKKAQESQSDSESDSDSESESDSESDSESETDSETKPDNGK